MTTKKENIFAVNIPEYHHDPVVVRYEVGGEATLDSMIEAFASFLQSLGYVFPEGMHLGYELDEDHNPDNEDTLPIPWDNLDTNNGYPKETAEPVDDDDIIKDKKDKNNLI
jgi:hypothetical protein